MIKLNNSELAQVCWRTQVETERGAHYASLHAYVWNPTTKWASYTTFEPGVQGVKYVGWSSTVSGVCAHQGQTVEEQKSMALPSGNKVKLNINTFKRHEWAEDVWEEEDEDKKKKKSSIN